MLAVFGCVNFAGYAMETAETKVASATSPKSATSPRNVAQNLAGNIVSSLEIKVMEAQSRGEKQGDYVYATLKRDLAAKFRDSIGKDTFTLDNVKKMVEAVFSGKSVAEKRINEVLAEIRI